MVKLNPVKRRQRFGCLSWGKRPSVEESAVFKIKDDDEWCMDWPIVCAIVSWHGGQNDRLSLGAFPRARAVGLLGGQIPSRSSKTGQYC